MLLTLIYHIIALICFLIYIYKKDILLSIHAESIYIISNFCLRYKNVYIDRQQWLHQHKNKSSNKESNSNIFLVFIYIIYVGWWIFLIFKLISKMLLFFDSTLEN